MSSSIKELFDFSLVKRLKCKTIGLKTNFHRDIINKDGLKSICKTCRNQY